MDTTSYKSLATMHHWSMGCWSNGWYASYQSWATMHSWSIGCWSNGWYITKILIYSTSLAGPMTTDSQWSIGASNLPMGQITMQAHQAYTTCEIKDIVTNLLPIICYTAFHIVKAHSCTVHNANVQEYSNCWQAVHCLGSDGTRTEGGLGGYEIWFKTDL